MVSQSRPPEKNIKKINIIEKLIDPTLHLKLKYNTIIRRLNVFTPFWMQVSTKNVKTLTALKIFGFKRLFKE